MAHVGVIGAGSWGTALALRLILSGHEVSIYDLDGEVVSDIKNNQRNSKYLGHIELPGNLSAVSDLNACIEDKDVILFAVPAQHFRNAVEEACRSLKGNELVINVAKGIEQKSLLRLSQISKDYIDPKNYVVLSGPSHAEDVALNMPTAVAVSSVDRSAALKAQDIFMAKEFRVYVTDDVIGTEIGGALKNVIALGAGIIDGLGFKDNALSAMMTRGLAEIARLGIAMGANEHTFYGLTGMGDLIVTCTSGHSRNRRCGQLIGKGMKASDAVERIGMVVEGMYTTKAAFELSKKYEVSMPITDGIHRIIDDAVNAEDAVYALLARDKKHERY